MINVKICGLTNLTDARVAVEAGADLLGFIFYAKSPRYVVPESVREIVQAIRGWRQETINARPILNPQSSILPLPRFIGLFVNESPATILEILTFCQLDLAQLQGNETPETVTALAGRAFKAIRPASLEQALADAARFAPLRPTADPALMVDAYDPNLYGGTGKQADAQIATQVARQVPGLLLAGGLTPENVADAIRAVYPWGVDVSSGVEAAPGQKDHSKVRAFVAAAKAVEQENWNTDLRR